MLMKQLHLDIQRELSITYELYTTDKSTQLLYPATIQIILFEARDVLNEN